jgi:hypothetical protein
MDDTVMEDNKQYLVVTTKDGKGTDDLPGDRIKGNAHKNQRTTH